MNEGVLTHDPEDLMLALQLPDHVAIRKADGRHRADGAAGAAADHATHGIDRDGLVVPHFIDAAPKWIICKSIGRVKVERGFFPLDNWPVHIYD
jgi:hypothetical protein